MMLEPVGGGEPALSAAAVDDFYASDAPGHQALSEAPTPVANFSADSNCPQLHADQFIPPPPPAESRATVSLGGSPPSAAAAAALSGTLDGRKDPGGAKFAVSQIHGVYLLLHRAVLSRCAPWSEFAAAAAFQRPCSGAAAVDRMQRNFRYFTTNYICICCCFAALCALLNPPVFAVAGLCGALCAFASLKGEVQIGDTRLPKKSFQGAVCAGSACLLLLLAGNAVMTLLLLCALVVSVHSALHKGVSYQTIAQKGEQQHPDLGV
ncbi:hypothetical protein, conserved [Eimeria necatrix]|uniref:PRA1 family protein n=1 Tax=Eimeria necatrix TaxID=51315 RepID=U6N099_9EIME|nr:hypothetical protein, conserved [Eimeria necatrix]CDJ69627.1 hypothetical protein, conserved [Eimeria necatrix]